MKPEDLKVIKRVLKLAGYQAAINKAIDLLRKDGWAFGCDTREKARQTVDSLQALKFKH